MAEISTFTQTSPLAYKPSFGGKKRKKKRRRKGKVKK